MSRVRIVAGNNIQTVPYMRAGLGMVDGIPHLIPSARVGHIGLYRDHDSLQPVDYYFKIPAGEHDRAFFVLDPMLATGGAARAPGGPPQKGRAPPHPFPPLRAPPAGARQTPAGPP